MSEEVQVAAKAQAKAKAKALALGAAPKEKSTIVIALNDLSTSEDSGWREVSRRRVEELKSEFLNGQFGMNVLKRPSVLDFAEQPVMSMDGRRKIADGKHTIVALGELMTLWADENEHDNHVWTEKLASVFEHGLQVSVLEFQDNDPDLVMAWATSTHDTESNKYQASSMRDLVKVAQTWHAKTAGNNWQETQRKLEGLFGKGRRMFIYRMITAAVTVPMEVLDALSASKIPNSWVHENKYFVGQGQDQNKRLSADNRIKVIEIADQDLESGKGMSGAVFQQEYCRPYKEAEKWLKSTRNQFGAVANMPAFERVADFLFTSRARVQLLACVNAGVKLDGISDQQPGIEACRTIVKELVTAQKAAAEAHAERNQIAAAASGDAPSGDEPSGDASSGNRDALDASSKMDVGESMLVSDPIADAASAKVDVDLARHQVYDPASDWANSIRGQLMPSQKVAILVDAPTSKIRVLADHLDKVSLMCKSWTVQRYRVLIPVGSRLDLLSTVDTKMRVCFPDLHHFTVQLVHGASRQKRNKRPQYLHFAATQDYIESNEIIPEQVPALSAKAKKVEFCRLRCMDSQCAHRPTTELDALRAKARITERDEIHGDDQDTLGVDEDVEEMDGNEGEEEEEKEDEIVLEMPPNRRDMIMELWPFAFSSGYYKHLLSSVSSKGAPAHLIIVSQSAHPGPILAARSLNVSTHAVYSRVSEHSKNHGRKILRDCMFADFVREGRKQQRGEKRVIAKESGFSVLQAPEDQTVLFEQAALGATWRSGFDQYPASDFLERAVPRLLQDELDSSILSISMVDGQRRLVTTKAAKEGDMLVVATALLFSSPVGITEFLNSGGNGALLEGPMIHVKGVRTQHHGGDASSTTLAPTKSVYAILVGVSRLVADFRGLRKNPNVAFQADPSQGANDGFLKLTVRTHNGCGIAAGSLITADFGEGYTISGAGASPAAKRFKGVLDDVFRRQIEKSAVAAPAGDPSSNDKAAAGAAGGGRGAGSAGAGSGAGSGGGAGTAGAGGGAGSSGGGTEPAGGGSGAAGAGTGGSPGSGGGAGPSGSGGGAGPSGGGAGASGGGNAPANSGTGASGGAGSSGGGAGAGAVAKPGEVVLANSKESAFIVGVHGAALVRSTDGKPKKSPLKRS